jgi:hypothetical protein
MCRTPAAAWFVVDTLHEGVVHVMHLGAKHGDILPQFGLRFRNVAFGGWFVAVLHCAYPFILYVQSQVRARKMGV